MAARRESDTSLVELANNDANVQRLQLLKNKVKLFLLLHVYMNSFSSC